MVYPQSLPFDEGYLKVSGIHTLHYMQFGNPDGKPVIVLHGGPGSGLVTFHTTFFNPNIYRIIAFSQRGSGKSTPLAETRENTTWDLVGDIEALREKLRVEKWLLFGGSWGSTLALAYAQNYPERCKGLILGGIFLAREIEAKWDLEGRRQLFPEAWDAYTSHIPPAERTDLMPAYLRRLQSTDHTIRMGAARAWNTWELAIGQLQSELGRLESMLNDEDWCLAHAVLEAHYFTHRCFLEEGQLLKTKNVDRIRHLPCSVVHGRYDVVCPPRNAWDLKGAWPEIELQFTPDAGHSFRETGTMKALVQIADRFASL
ncbi:prolyl aminopeptidase serine peptidase [Naematelia encephala]|uniref:Proline iminopeptidase n=1 Tax=Naematelia encephala TaxID=71784 RepID=A0A1Y2AFZ7_9TREE|nr:prolyl aminopeptidase serine peptidase [Naematelia encephala]